MSVSVSLSIFLTFHLCLILCVSPFCPPSVYLILGWLALRKSASIVRVTQKLIQWLTWAGAQVSKRQRGPELVNSHVIHLKGSPPPREASVGATASPDSSGALWQFREGPWAGIIQLSLPQMPDPLKLWETLHRGAWCFELQCLGYVVIWQ